MIPTWLGILLGVIMGVFSGLGVGGGKLLVPALVVFWAISQRTAQGVALIAFLPIAGIAGYIHRRAGVVDLDATLWLVAGSVLGAGLGAWVALRTDNSILQRLYGGFLSVIALYEMFNKEGTKGK